MLTGNKQRVPDPHFGRNKDEERGRDPKAQRALWLFTQCPHGLLMKTSHCHSNTSNPKHLTLLGNTLSHPTPTASYYRLLRSFQVAVKTLSVSMHSLLLVHLLIFLYFHLICPRAMVMKSKWLPLPPPMCAENLAQGLRAQALPLKHLVSNPDPCPPVQLSRHLENRGVGRISFLGLLGRLNESILGECSAQGLPQSK